MDKKKIRISIDLTEPVVKILRVAANADGRLLKNYLEKKLTAVAKRKETQNGN